jgi:nitroreductase
MNDNNYSRVGLIKEAMTHRRSVRAFKDDPIPEDVLNDLITAAKSAPSGSNWQNQRYLLITSPEAMGEVGAIRFVWPYKKANQAKVRESHPGGILGHGAALIIVFADAARNDARGNGEYYIWESLEIQNCAASIQNILTMAAAHGLGSCWVSASENMNYTRMLSGQTWRDALKDYDIPPTYKMQGIVVLGYPKSVDEKGYAKGEKMHGATNWVSTAREPNEFYMVKRKRGDRDEHQVPSGFSRLKILGYSSVIKVCLRLLRYFDKRIHRVEYKRYLRGKGGS